MYTIPAGRYDYTHYSIQTITLLFLSLSLLNTQTSLLQMLKCFTYRILSFSLSLSLSLSPYLFLSLGLPLSHTQSDQIGQFLKVLGKKCHTKVAQVFSDFGGYFEKRHFLVITTMPSFEATC